MTTNESPAAQNPFAFHRPVWSDWNLAKTMRLWHAVALACDLEPGQFTTFGNPELDRLLTRPGKRFDNLLIRAMNCLGDGGILKPVATNTETVEYSEESLISISNFGAWVKSIRFKVPPEFPWRDELIQPMTREWPWGSHYETDLLQKLAKAGNKFWKNYDPSDITTAHTNDDVVEWLVNDQQVSTSLARAMATILRADDLPTGRRKK
jgi:hypothetical protein